MTKVVFYVSRGTNPEVLAVFPEVPSSVLNPDLMLCYAHLGQHSSCVSEYLRSCRLATPEEYSDLQSELEGQGYDDLEVVSRMPRKAAAIRRRNWAKIMEG